MLFVLSVPNNSSPLSTIARFDPIKNSWTKMGDLKTPRYGHSVVQVDNKFIVYGGQQGYHAGNFISTESCELHGQKMVCAEREPRENYKLNAPTEYPELIIMR